MCHLVPQPVGYVHTQVGVTGVSHTPGLFPAHIEQKSHHQTQLIHGLPSTCTQLRALLSPHHGDDFMVVPKLSTTDTPKNKGNLGFPGDAENRCWITHTPEKHLDFLTLCWALEVAQGSDAPSDHSLVSLPWELPNPTIHKGRRGGREAQISLSLQQAWTVPQRGPGNIPQDFRGGKTRASLKTSLLHRNAAQWALTPRSCSPLAFPWEE